MHDVKEICTGKTFFALYAASLEREKDRERKREIESDTPP